MIVAEDLEQTYLSGGRPLTVLRQINLVIEPQEFVALTGPSGSGKTTLLGLLAGLDLPTKGVVRLDGENLPNAPHLLREVAAGRNYVNGIAVHSKGSLPDARLHTC